MRAATTGKNTRNAVGKRVVGVGKEGAWGKGMHTMTAKTNLLSVFGKGSPTISTQSYADGFKHVDSVQGRGDHNAGNLRMPVDFFDFFLSHVNE